MTFSGKHPKICQNYIGITWKIFNFTLKYNSLSKSEEKSIENMSWIMLFLKIFDKKKNYKLYQSQNFSNQN